MKKIFSIFLICCASFAFADDEPVFEETGENVKVCAYTPFRMNAPVFDEDGDARENTSENDQCCGEDCDGDECEGCGECGSNDKDEETQEQQALFAYSHVQNDIPEFEETEEDHNKFRASYASWRRYKANFGMEKLFVCFPHKPAMSQSNTLLTAYAYDRAVMHSICGYYPPMGNIDPILWFEDVRYSVDSYPCSLVSHCVFQVSNGDWVMDYVAQDYIQNLVIKGRAIVTPFNAYTLQCVKPNGTRDYFDYFVDNFWIKCECH